MLNLLVPDLQLWKEQSDAGKFATRLFKIRKVDTAVQHYNEAREKFRAAYNASPAGVKVAQRLEAAREQAEELKKAVEHWLAQKEDATESARKPQVEGLRDKILREIDLIETALGHGDFKPSTAEGWG
jgi:hypothetical protein